MATIEIDGKSYEAQVGQMLIEVTDKYGIDIPRFCYHKKLSVAANCRMCLVEVEKAPKPMPACATPVMDGMKVYTKSPKALTAQKAVMEFLLINHPLDCPICDQGGECELQDIAVGYGKDESRYQERKRVVTDKDIGSLVATEMTRCIHCTRCVRFGVEIAGIKEFGATGRGEHMKIGTYVEKTLNSELSGNIVDLCPVGALTNKVFRFSARTWEMQQRDAIAPHDAVGSNIHVHVRRNEVMRVIPRENEAVNEIWLSDRDRYSFEALQAADRLKSPMVKRDGKWENVDWETALTVAVEGLQKVIKQHQASAVGALASPTATLEELYLLQKVMRGVGSANLDHRLRQLDFSDQAVAPLFPALGQGISELETCQAALVIGSNTRKEQPLLNHRLRKASLKGAKIMVVNPVDYDFNFRLAQKIISTPANMLNALAGIAKALVTKVGNASAEVQSLLTNVTADSAQEAIAAALLAGERKTVLLGNLAVAHPQFAQIRALAGIISQLSDATFGYLGEAANTSGAWLAGMLPHRLTGGTTANQVGLNAGEMLTKGLKAYVLLGLEPELDSLYGQQALTALNQAEFVVSLTAYRNTAAEEYADVLLPISIFAETSGTYVNVEGRWQSFAAAVTPTADIRPAWKVLRVIGNLFNLNGFDYLSSEDVLAETKQNCADKAVTLQTWQMPTQLASTNGSGWQCINETPIYAVDMLVRRAAALQQTRDALITEGLHINPAMAAKSGLVAGGTVKVSSLVQGAAKTTLPVVLDERVPDECVLIYAGHCQNTAVLAGTNVGLEP